MLNKRILVIAVALIAAAMLAVPISVVYATKPMPAAGTFFPTAEPGLSPRFAGKSANNFPGIIDDPRCGWGVLQILLLVMVFG